MTSGGGGGFLTPLGSAASDERPPPRSVRSASYSALLASALNPEQAHQIRELVSEATGRKPRTLRDWRQHGVPESGRAGVQRAAAVWRLGGIGRAAEAFGLSVRRTLSWLAGRGRRTRQERERIEQAIWSSGVGATLRVRVRFDTISGGVVGRSESGREVETTLDVHENVVATLDELVRAGNIDAALQILEPLLFEQYMFEQVDMNLTELLTPQFRAEARYVLTPSGVIGPGYGG